jgi:hypothetical protein
MGTSSGLSRRGTQWMWTCACGAAGEPHDDRERVREEFKQHRRTCGMGNQPEGGSIMSTTAKENAVKPAKASKTPKAASGTPATAPAKPGRKRQQSVDAAQAKDALARLKAGGTTLIAESKRLGFSHNGPLRGALRELVGQKGYDALIEGLGSKPAMGKKGKAAAPAKKAPAKGKAAAPAKKAASKKASETVKEAPAAPAPTSGGES